MKKLRITIDAELNPADYIGITKTIEEIRQGIKDAMEERL